MDLKVLNINIGLLGHVDSGKTALAKCLSETGSTAAFDKSPQSQQRGISLDLGFSSFSLTELPERFTQLGYQRLQLTLVDCPGHASLIRTIIGGVQIIDLVILVVDALRGVQTQTAECLLIAQITKKPLMVALNKIDLIESTKRDEVIEKVTKKMEQTLADLKFIGCPIVPVIAREDYLGDRGLSLLTDKLTELLEVPERAVGGPLVTAVDHCFQIRGKGTILTGTILQGTLRLNDLIEIPCLKESRRVKTIQMFRCDVSEARAGDRIGFSVKQFDPTSLERGLISVPGFISQLYAVIATFSLIKYFRGTIASNSKFHISIGHETIIGRIKLFSSQNTYDNFNMNNEYIFLDKYNEECNDTIYSLIEFEKPVYVAPKSILIGSKLDVNIESKSCRLAFYGSIILSIKDKNYSSSVLPMLKMYSIKEKTGIVHSLLNEKEIICVKLFKKSSAVQKFLNFKIILSSGEIGYIAGSFGQKDKVRLVIPEGLKASTLEFLSPHKKSKRTDFKIDKKELISVKLPFKKYLFHSEKRVCQTALF